MGLKPDSVANLIAPALRVNPHLSRVRVSDNLLGDAGVLDVAMALPPSVRSLHIANNGMSDEVATAFADLLAERANLRVSVDCGTVVGVGALLGAQGWHRDRLQLGSSGITGATAALIASSLPHNRSLRHLDISENSIPERFVVALVRAEAGRAVLRHLDLSGLGLAQDACRALSDLLRHASIRVLKASRNPIGPSGGALLAEALSACSTLTHLDLCSAEILDAGAAPLLMALRTNRSLKTLRLGFNGLRDAGEVATMLRRNGALTKLDLSHNGFEDSAIAEALSTNATLAALDATGNRLASSVDAFVYHMSLNRSLRRVVLADNGLSGRERLKARREPRIEGV